MNEASWAQSPFILPAILPPGSETAIDHSNFPVYSCKPIFFRHVCRLEFAFRLITGDHHPRSASSRFRPEIIKGLP